MNLNVTFKIMRQFTFKGQSYDVVENLDDVFSSNQGKNIKEVSEYDGYYYLRFEPDHMFDKSMYKINKTTLEAEGIHQFDYFPIEGKTTPVCPDKILALKKQVDKLYNSASPTRPLMKPKGYQNHERT